MAILYVPLPGNVFAPGSPVQTVDLRYSHRLVLTAVLTSRVENGFPSTCEHALSNLRLHREESAVVPRREYKCRLTRLGTMV